MKSHKIEPIRIDFENTPPEKVYSDMLNSIRSVLVDRQEEKDKDLAMLVYESAHQPALQFNFTPAGLNAKENDFIKGFILYCVGEERGQAFFKKANETISELGKEFYDMIDESIYHRKPESKEQKKNETVETDA